ncbi:LysR family transcriptional regulator [bacterium M00.F.Ca.ET.194.01.1.1]|nr:LysR family transcriptional regulator [bacterium M00.F.Ca.ET.194.01.1.1]TGS52337.1 LysR family transcriptional regulator [bacterium M00.F.Ca.ET.179.01.1.1]TGV44198.1 LysR family transcriptional regulator [bacterium M00.F.Ca.ET.168.01.1.1]
MNSVDLKFFQAVVKASTIGGAAFALNTVQSNVTSRIKALEDEVGAPLFHRSRRGVTLTSVGMQLVPYAERISELLDEAKQVVTEREIPSGDLRIGAMETTAALRLPPILIEYSKACSVVDVQVETGPTEVLVTRVLNRELDGAFVAGPIDHIELIARPVVDEELVLISSPAVRTLDDIGGSTLAGMRVLAFRAGCAYRRRMDNFLANIGAVEVRWMELGTLDGIIGCVAAGVGIAMLPRAVVQQAAASGLVKMHAIPRNLRLATTMFIYRKGQYLPASLRSFIGVYEEVFSREAAKRDLPHTLKELVHARL